jgi:hypothetical protein
MSTACANRPADKLARLPASHAPARPPAVPPEAGRSQATIAPAPRTRRQNLGSEA